VRRGLKVRKDRRGYKVRRVTPALRASRALLERPVRKEIPDQLELQVHKDLRGPKETPAPRVRRERRGFRATSVLRARKVIQGRPVRRVFQVLKGCKGNLDRRDLLGRAVAVLTESANLLKVEPSRFQQASPISSWRCGERAVGEVPALAAAVAPGAIPVRLFLSHPEGLTTLWLGLADPVSVARTTWCTIFPQQAKTVRLPSLLIAI
jgi:hypothetical protein